MQNLTEQMQGSDEQEHLSELKELPQEIVHEIITFVPEYGHRVNRYLHHLSLDNFEPSFYCDFYRYFTGCGQDVLETVIRSYRSNVSVAICGGINRYLQANIYGLLFKYIEVSYIVSEDMLTSFGISGSAKFTRVLWYYPYTDEKIFRDTRYYYRVIGLYVQMILYNKGLIDKGEFDDYCKDNEADIDTSLEIIIGVYFRGSHIFRNAVRYFDKRLCAAAENAKNSLVITNGILYDNERYKERAKTNVDYLLN